MSGRWADRPVRAPVGLQRWQDVTFLHWRYDPGVLQPLMPPGLVPQVHDGSAWVGVTPFLMRGARAPLTPALPYLSTFAEVNVRTYVRSRRPGVGDGLWFFTLECPRPPVVAALRAVGLPYRRAGTELVRTGAGLRAVSARTGGRAAFRAVIEPGEPMRPTAREDFLTGRWAAFFPRLGRLWRVPVEHEPWPLHHARATADADALLTACGLPAPTGEPVVHFAPAVRARIGLPRPA